jgi:hypothetical protein
MEGTCANRIMFPPVIEKYIVHENVTLNTPEYPVVGGCESCKDIVTRLVDENVWKEVKDISLFLSMLTPIDSGEIIDFSVALRDIDTVDKYYTAGTLAVTSLADFHMQLLDLSSPTAAANIASDTSLLIPLNILLFATKGHEYAPAFIHVSKELLLVAKAIQQNIPSDVCITGRCDDVDDCSDGTDIMSQDEDSSDDPDYHSMHSADEDEDEDEEEDVHTDDSESESNSSENDTEMNPPGTDSEESS